MVSNTQFRMRYQYTGNLLGKGTFSKVQEALDIIDVKHVAVKQWKHYKVYKTEQYILSHLLKTNKSHLGYNNVIHMIDVIQDTHSYSVVLEKMDGTLYQLLRIYPSGLPVDMVRDLMYQLCIGLSYIHECGIIHGDLKPENIMYTYKNNKYTYKIGDFSNSLLISEGTNRYNTKVIQTSFYRSFESIVFHNIITPESDLPSMACIAYEMATGKVLFPFYDTETVDTHINEEHLLAMLNTIGLEKLCESVQDHHNIAVPDNVLHKINKLSAKGKLNLPLTIPHLKDLLKTWLLPFADQRGSALSALSHDFFTKLG